LSSAVLKRRSGRPSGLLLGYLPAATAREICSRRDVILGGVFAPRGRATPAGEGFRVSGRWPFASGCQSCDWLMGGCVVADGDRVRTLPGGQPDVRLMLAPADEVKIHDTWRVMGLRATGSHDIEFDRVWIAPERSASLFSDSPVQPGPLYAFPIFGLLAIAIRLAATHAATSAAGAVASAYRLGGAGAIYESSPLQRRFRDANVATQHMLVAPATWELTGRMLLGLDTDTTQL
jgi:indole-3-acetate monooxygenase